MSLEALIAEIEQAKDTFDAVAVSGKRQNPIERIVLSHGVPMEDGKPVSQWWARVGQHHSDSRPTIEDAVLNLRDKVTASLLKERARLMDEVAKCDAATLALGFSPPSSEPKTVFDRLCAEENAA